ncbi:hypothetical protein FB382_001864 [Nocardioides ginsengisegetis]|uniref:Terminase small subunit n=1 Tax=Nocardioides ginsengisegetis TaxID=661491 RepID=A0A7W3IZK8_9ACTN|nr:hypothetical protein [Nocardioides ginsengisegetis]MBA8803573.1 hypothetical protein [Nocardioides ginsengisegetis]
MAAKKPNAPHLAVVASAGARRRYRARAGAVTAAANSGDQRAVLVAIRTRLAREVDSPHTAARDLAALTIRLLAVNAEIRELDAAAKAAGADSTSSGTGGTPDEAFGPSDL